MKKKYFAIALLFCFSLNAQAETSAPSPGKWPDYAQWEQDRFTALPPVVQRILKHDEAAAVKLIEQNPKLIVLTVTKHEVERTANPKVLISYMGGDPQPGYPLVILATAANMPQLLAAMSKHKPEILFDTDPNGEQSLYWAIKAQAYEAAEFLTSHGLDPLRMGKRNAYYESYGFYDSPFSRAMQRWDMRMVKILLAHIPRQNMRSLEGHLANVADITDIEWLRLFLEAGVNPNSRSSYPETTPLVQAVVHGRLANVKLLIEHGAKDDGKTFGRKKLTLIQIADLSVKENEPDTLEIQRLIHALGKSDTVKTDHSELNQDDLDALRKKAMEATVAHQGELAFELWNQLLQANPDDALALRMRGVLYAEQGKRELSLADHLRAEQLTPWSASNWNTRCWSKILLGDFVGAQTDCAKAVSIDPGNSSAVVNLGHTWLLQGNTEKAYEWYPKALLLILDKAELAEVLVDFDLFKKHGWQPKLSQKGKSWFEKRGKAWLARKAPADNLRVKARAAQESKDRKTEIQLRIEHITALKKLLDANHPIVIRAVDDLADAYVIAKQPNLAVPLYLRVIDYRQNLDENPPLSLKNSISKTMNALAAPEYTLELAPVLEKLFAISKKRRVNVIELNLFMARQIAQELIEERESKEEHALTLAKRAYDDLLKRNANAEEQLDALSGIIQALDQLQRQTDGIPYLKKMLPLLEQNKEQNFDKIINTLESIAALFARDGQPDVSWKYYKQSLAMQRRDDDKNMLNYTYLSTISRTGQMLSNFDDYLDEATRYLEYALQLAEQLYGKDGAATKVMAKQLEEHKRKLGKRGKPESGKTP